MNTPTFCPNASWNSTATTFADETNIGAGPLNAMFINRHDTIVATHPKRGYLLIWHNASAHGPFMIPERFSWPQSVFATDDDVIFVDSACPHSRIERWSLENHLFLSSIPIDQQCRDLFVDGDDVYCSQEIFHQVVKYSWRNPSRPPTVVAGMKCAGNSSSMLRAPHGIFVSKNKDLYVADWANNRIQKFRSGERNGTTVAGDGASGTISLDGPIDVVVGGDGYLFIVDSKKDRILGSDANGFRCIVGCTGTRGWAADQLHGPRSLSFDSRGNLYVVDYWNDRIQRFALQRNDCSEYETCI